MKRGRSGSPLASPPPTRGRHSREEHLSGRAGWLRAAVLGANDGLISVGSLVLGVSASHASPGSVLVAGVSAWLAGAMSMAAGEYVSVSSQADARRADLKLERRELASHPREEQRELADIYIQRGLRPALAAEVARELMARDALGAHARDEIGIPQVARPRPIRAGLTSAVSFTLGVLPPLAVISLAPAAWLLPGVVTAVLAGLLLLGTLGARAGGAPARRAALRVVLAGALALAVTGAVGVALGALR